MFSSFMQTSSATSFHSLDKVKAHMASAAFLLSSKLTTEDATDEDAEQMMRALVGVIFAPFSFFPFFPFFFLREVNSSMYQFQFILETSNWLFIYFIATTIH